MNENGSIKELENHAKNMKHLMDKLNKAYLGMTMEEIIRMALEGRRNETANQREDRTDG